MLFICNSPRWVFSSLLLLLLLLLNISYSLSRSNFHQPFIMVRVKASEQKCVQWNKITFFLLAFPLLWSFSCHPKTSSTTRARVRSLRFAQLIVKRRILRCFCHFLLLVTRAPKSKRMRRRRLHFTCASSTHFCFTSTASAKALQYRFHFTSISLQIQWKNQRILLLLKGLNNLVDHKKTGDNHNRDQQAFNLIHSRWNVEISQKSF